MQPIIRGSQETEKTAMPELGTETMRELSTDRPEAAKKRSRRSGVAICGTSHFCRCAVTSRHTGT